MTSFAVASFFTISASRWVLTVFDISKYFFMFASATIFCVMACSFISIALSISSLKLFRTTYVYMYV